MVFCPPDHLNWNEMREFAQNWARRAYLADALELLGEDPQNALRTDFNLESTVQDLDKHRNARTRLNLKDRHFEVELITFWIMNKLDEDYGAALCTSSGSLLRSNHPIFFHPDQFFFFYLRFPLREMAELTRIYEEYDARRMFSQDLWARYCCIDAETGEIKQKNHTLKHFDNYFGDGASGSGKETFDRYVKPFLGFYIVWDPEIFPDNHFDIFESIGLTNKFWSKPDDKVSGELVPRKRGPKPSPAKQEFEKRYPDGLPDGLSAEAVAAELSEAGFPITGRSIQNYDRSRKIRK